MRARPSAMLVAFVLLLAPTLAGAFCPSWKVGPFWQDFLVNGANSTVGCSTLWDPDGAGPEVAHLVVSGGFSAIQGVSASGLAMLDPVTGQWQAIPNPPNGQIDAMTVYNGQLVVGGTFTTAGGVTVNDIASYDGTSWHAFSTGMSVAVYVRALTVWNGQLIAGGTFQKAGGVTVNNIASWDGSSWHALSSGTNGEYVTCLTPYGTQLIVGGVFTSAGGVTVSNVAAWDGSSFSAMSTGLVGAPAAFQPFNGGVYAAVQTTVAGTPASYIGHWTGSGWLTSTPVSHVTLSTIAAFQGNLFVAGSATTGGGGPANGVFTYNGSLNGLRGGITGTTLTLMPFNGDLVVGGSFTAADGRLANRIARWDGTDWGTFGGGNTNGVDAILDFGNGYVIGGDLHQYLRVGPEAHNVVGFFNGQMYAYGQGMDGPVTALKTYTTGIGVNRNSVIYAGGTFVNAGGVVANNIARWTQSSIIINPSAWAAMGPGFDGPVSAVERFNNVDYAAGSFSNSGAVSLANIARFNETTKQWEAVGIGMDGPIYALKVFGSYLYAGGAFTHAGTVLTGGLARYDGASWSAVGGDFLGTVNALEVFNNRLVMAGSFAGFGGSPNISSFDGTSYFNLGSGGTNGNVRSLHADGTRLYVGGDFTSIGGVSVNRLGEYDGSWHDVLGGADNSVNAIGNYHNQVLIGGVFTNVDFGSFVGTPTCAIFDETGVPEFASNPSSQSVNIGDNVTFSAIPDTGYTGLSLQWVFDGNTALSDGPTGHGSTISGAHTENLNITNVQAGDIGSYALTVHNSCGTDTSFSAQLTGPLAVDGTGMPAANVFDAIGPNPSVGATQVYFSLARDARVRLAVRDVAGRLIRSVDAGRLVAGRHQAAWDARGTDGARAHAGVYFVELEVDGARLGTRRLTIVR